MIQFLKTLKLYTKLVPETVHCVYPILKFVKFISDHHYRHQLMKCFLQLEHHIESVKSITLSQKCPWHI